MYKGVPSKGKAEKLGERKTQLLASASDELSAKQMIFVDWWGQPEDLRTPLFQKDLAKQLGVCERTLIEWKKNPLIGSLRAKLVDIHILDYEIPDVKLALVKKAKSGHIMACKFLLEAFGLFATKEQAIPQANILILVQNQIAQVSPENLKLISDTLEHMEEPDDN